MIRTIALLGVSVFALDPGCDEQPTVDQQQAAEQARSLEQAHAKIGMPNIINFREKETLKEIREDCDTGIATHAYLENPMLGCLIYLGPAEGYAIPYAAQFTAPTKHVPAGNCCGYEQPQAESNGLFMPSSAEGTWVKLKDPNGTGTKSTYFEPRVVVSPYRLTNVECKPISDPTAKK